MSHRPVSVASFEGWSLRRVAGALCALPFLMMSSPAWSVPITETIGNNDYSNYAPFITTDTRYLQIYDAAQFSAPISITSIEFPSGSSGNLSARDFELRLATTSSSSRSYSLTGW